MEWLRKSSGIPTELWAGDAVASGSPLLQKSVPSVINEFLQRLLARRVPLAENLRQLRGHAEVCRFAHWETLVRRHGDLHGIVGKAEVIGFFITLAIVASIFRGLPGNDGDIARLHSLGRRDEDGGIKLGELSNFRRGQVVAILRPVSVKFFDA